MDQEITASLSIPNHPNHSENINPCTKLIDQDIKIEYHPSVSKRPNVTLNLRATKITDWETTPEKFEELRDTQRVANDQFWGIQDGQLGRLHKVSLGNFDEDHKFETTYTWTYEEEDRFRVLSYLGGISDPRFRVCLTHTDQEGMPNWEWMNLREFNIQGVIFEKLEEEHPDDRRVIYFVVDKPPQFYQRTQAALSPPSAIFPKPSVTTAGPHHQIRRPSKLVHSRISHSSSMKSLRVDDLDNLNICNVPWIIQYSRIIKVEYEQKQVFDIVSYTCRLSQPLNRPLFSFEYLRIVKSKRTTSAVASTVKMNMLKISRE